MNRRFYYLFFYIKNLYSNPFSSTRRWVGLFLSMNKLLFSAVFALLVMVACKPTKKIQTAIAPKDTSVVVKMSDPTIDSAAVKRTILAKVNSNKINVTTFNAKVKLDFTDVKGKNKWATLFFLQLIDAKEDETETDIELEEHYLQCFNDTLAIQMKEHNDDGAKAREAGRNVIRQWQKA